jgi:hypothetical protein
MVLARLSLLVPLCVLSCGGALAADADGGTDATVTEDASDAADESKDAGTDAFKCKFPSCLDIATSCDGGGPIDAGLDFHLKWGYWACCQGKVCRGWCNDAGACVCGKVPGGCAPLYCCGYNEGPPYNVCLDFCGKGG